MNALLRDKCFARRLSRAGCVESLGIRRVRHDAEDTRVDTPSERVLAWRMRSGRVGMGNAFKFKRKQRDWHPTVPQPLMRTRPELPTTPLPFGRVGPLPTPPTPAFDDESGWDEYMRRAFAGEILPF